MGLSFCCFLGGSNCSSDMEPTGSGANNSSKEEIAETPLISGLPDEVALLCLVRVPRTYHAKLKCVSKRWRELVCGEEWPIIRKKDNLEETWIYALCQDRFGKDNGKHYCYVLDPYAPRRYWKRIQDLPPCILRRQFMNFEVLGQKAYLIGGIDGTPNIADEVYCYDAITNSWSKAAPLSTPRCEFASAVLDGKIYAVGSLVNPDGRHTWESYDPITNTWTAAQSDPHVIGHPTESVIYNEKLYVWDSSDGLNSSGAVYEPSTGTWHDADTNLVSGFEEQTVVAEGRLYTFKEGDEKFKVSVWQEDRKKWVLVAKVETGDWSSMHQVVAIGKSIFVIGLGLATAEFDVGNVGNGGGVLMMSNPTRQVFMGYATSCKCMTI